MSVRSKRKRCSRCRKRRLTKFFTKNRSKPDGLNHLCVICQRRYNKRHYAANKPYYVAKAHRITAAQRERMYAIVDEIKSVPCKDCRRSFPPVAMDFDHVRGKKVASISTMCGGGWSEKRIRAELAKCEIRCAVCHRLRTHKHRVTRPRPGGSRRRSTKPVGSVRL